MVIAWVLISIDVLAFHIFSFVGQRFPTWTQSQLTFIRIPQSSSPSSAFWYSLISLIFISAIFFIYFNISTILVYLFICWRNSHAINYSIVVLENEKNHYYLVPGWILCPIISVHHSQLVSVIDLSKASDTASYINFLKMPMIWVLCGQNFLIRFLINNRFQALPLLITFFFNRSTLGLVCTNLIVLVLNTQRIYYWCYQFIQITIKFIVHIGYRFMYLLCRWVRLSLYMGNWVIYRKILHDPAFSSTSDSSNPPIFLRSNFYW